MLGKAVQRRKRYDGLPVGFILYAYSFEFVSSTFAIKKCVGVKVSQEKTYTQHAMINLT